MAPILLFEEKWSFEKATICAWDSIYSDSDLDPKVAPEIDFVSRMGD